jgi:hypothetical protein
MEQDRPASEIGKPAAGSIGACKHQIGTGPARQALVSKRGLSGRLSAVFDLQVDEGDDPLRRPKGRQDADETDT